MRKSWQYTLLGAAIAFFVLYGIELASDGIEDVYGPMEQRTDRRAGGYGYNGDPYPAGRGGAAPRHAPYGPWPDEAYGDAFGSEGAPGSAARPEDEGRMPDGVGAGGYGYAYGTGGEGGGTISRLADGAAGLLQSAAKGGIRFIVSLFESVAN